MAEVLEVALPIGVAPPFRKICTVLLASAVPVKDKVASLVILSPVIPVSVLKLAIAGAAGAVVSIVKLKLAEFPLTLPATSLALAVNVYVPSGKVVPVSAV